MIRHMLFCGLTGLMWLAPQTLFAESDDLTAAESSTAEIPDPFAGPSLARQPEPEAASGEAPRRVPIQPPPAPDKSGEPEAAPPETSVPEDSSPASKPGTPREQAIERIVEAQERINQGQFDAAIAAADESIALDPENAAVYRKVRAKAYAMQGQYEQALADVSPLELTVGVPQARLMSGRNVVAIVPGGTKLLATEVRGVWVKVSLATDQNPIVGWIHQDALDRGPQPSQVLFGPPEPLRPGWEFSGEHYYRRPYHDYGRRYYDYWQHVPPRYWRYLP